MSKTYAVNGTPPGARVVLHALDPQGDTDA
jgi:hypothetical protein